MNELIGTALIFVVVIAIVAMIYVCEKIGPMLIDQITGFIRWRRTMSGKTKDVYYHRNKD